MLGSPSCQPSRPISTATPPAGPQVLRPLVKCVGLSSARVIGGMDRRTMETAVALGVHICVASGLLPDPPPPLWGRTALCGVVAVPGSHRHERCSHQWRGPPADSELLLRHCGGGQHHPLLPPHHDGGPGRGAPISARRLSSGKRASATHEGGRGVRLLSPPPYVPWPLRLTACWRWGSRSRAGQWLACNPEGWLLIKCFLICTPQPVLGQPPNGILWVPPPLETMRKRGLLNRPPFNASKQSAPRKKLIAQRRGANSFWVRETG